MWLPVLPPVAPMLGRLARELPGDGFLYEPKWDGFRCLAFRCGGEVDLRSRNDRPLARYFPEVVTALGSLACERVALDGELLVLSGAGFDFDALLARIHPAAARVERLSRETPASFVAFDVLAVGDRDLRAEPFRERRARLAAVLEDAQPPLHLTPATSDDAVASRWLDRFHGAGIDGVMAKAPDLPYRPGARAMVKVKRERTVDCVAAGIRLFEDRPLPSSLLLGLYDEGSLVHVGRATAFSEGRRRELLDELRPLAVPLADHPWREGFLSAGSRMGRLKGAAARWQPNEMEQDWIPLAPVRVCEVAVDQVDQHRFRHPARFRRWRPDREPASCALGQLEVPPARPADLLRP